MAAPPTSRPDSTIVVVSIDTEEDNWSPARQDITVENIRELPYFHAFLRRLGARPTYLTTYQVALQPWAAHILREIRDGGAAEIGAHLHPWNTPPLDEPFVPRNTMLKNLAAPLQLAKLERLTATMRDAFGIGPTSFRAGRYGFGEGTAAALIRCGYRVESSVTPFVSWEDQDDGPNFMGAPLDAYSLSDHGDARIPDPAGRLLEIPLSAGYNRSPFALWSRVREVLAMEVLQPFRLAGVAARTGVFKRIFLSPESASAAEMLDVSRRLIDHGVAHLQLSLHSPSLRPGMSEFTAVAADVTRLYQSIDAYLDGLHRFARVTFATIDEAATLLGQPRRAVA
jgi:hypothetical protein